MDVYKLYAAPNATTNAVASLDVQRSGHIVAYDARLVVLAADALDDGFVIECSFGSTIGSTSNDTKASILTMAARQSFLTSGGGPVEDRTSLSGIALPVSAGERIYLHSGLNGTGPTAIVYVYLYVMELPGGETRPATRLR